MICEHWGLAAQLGGFGSCYYSQLVQTLQACLKPGGSLLLFYIISEIVRLINIKVNKTLHTPLDLAIKQEVKIVYQWRP